MPRTTAALALLLTLSPALLPAQDLDAFVPRPGETALDFVSRVKPAGEELGYPVLETSAWDSRTPSIIAFSALPREEENASEVVGHLYLRQDDVDYRRDVTFGTFLGEGEYPQILDVFWRNLDADPEPELLVWYRYLTVHYDFTGYIGDVAVLDNPTVLSDALEPLDLFGDAFVTFDGMNGGGGEAVPAYTTREEILAMVAELGY